MKAAVVITLFFPPLTSLEHISFPPHFELHPPTFSMIRSLPEGFPACQRDAIKDHPTQGPPTTAVVLCLDVEQFT